MTNRSFDKSPINSCSHREIHEKVDIRNTATPSIFFYLHKYCTCSQFQALYIDANLDHFFQTKKLYQENCAMNN